MKKFISLFLCTIVLFTSFTFTANAKDITTLDISKDKVAGEIDKNIYGISADSISSVNGTDISANLVYNNSFEHYDLSAESADLSEDYWSFSNLKHKTDSKDSLNRNNKNYEVIKVSDKGEMTNYGFNEGDKSTASMGFKEKTKYDFSCYIKNVDFEGSVYVYLDSSSNENVLTQLDITNSKSKWKKISATLESAATEDGALTIMFEGKGTLQIDFVSLIPEDSYGYDKEEWKFAPIRYDVQKAIANLKPSYIRIPLVINDDMSIEDYSWKDTVGAVEERKYTENNTSETGFSEYFNLCDDIDAEPVPSFNANVANLKENELKNYIQNIFDLIEYANGGSVKTYWGAIRSGHGHTKPYNLKAIELVGDDSANFTRVCKEIKNKYPEIQLILSSGDNNSLFEIDMESAFKYANEILLKEQGNEDSLTNNVYPILTKADYSSISLTPTYFAQMIFINNSGNKRINSYLSDENKGLLQSVTVNEAEQVIYVKVANTNGSSKEVNLNLNGFENINYVSKQSFSSKRVNSKNKVGNYYIAPKETELKANGNSVKVELDKYSVNVIRITYGGNDGASLYKLPNDLPVAKDFISDPVKILIPCGILVIVALSAIITIVVKSSKHKKKK